MAAVLFSAFSWYAAMVVELEDIEVRRRPDIACIQEALY